MMTNSDKEINGSKFGIGNVNLPLKNGWCPIHLAAAGEHQVLLPHLVTIYGMQLKLHLWLVLQFFNFQGVIEVLLRYGALIDKPMSATNNKVTALIMATQAGNMDLVKFLVKHQAKIAHPGRDEMALYVNIVSCTVN